MEAVCTAMAVVHMRPFRKAINHQESLFTRYTLLPGATRKPKSGFLGQALSIRGAVQT